MSAGEERSQLAWEAHRARPAALSALGSAVLPFLAPFLLALVLGAEGTGDAAALTAADTEPAGLIAFGLLSAVAVLLLVPALGYLLRATRARRPETPAFATSLLTAATIALAAVILAQQIIVVDLASGFTAGDTSDETAAGLIDGSAVPTSEYIRQGLNVFVGVAVVLIALNAMRAGLLSRFMGILGIAFGAFYAIPIFGGPVLIQLFWMVALAVLLLDRWPGGRGPAWERVEAVPWPGAAERMEEQRRLRGDVEGSGADEPSDVSAPSELDRPRPASRKRRRGRDEPG